MSLRRASAANSKDHHYEATPPHRQRLRARRSRLQVRHHQAAEAAPKLKAMPEGKEMVSIRLDRAVLEHFQEDGPGWQDRINAALRTAAGLDKE
jgi:uncharacterized protein (DUF4415 family)